MLATFTEDANWYQTRHDDVEGWATTAEVPPATYAGVLAATSPLVPWKLSRNGILMNKNVADKAIAIFKAAPRCGPRRIREGDRSSRDAQVVTAVIQLDNGKLLGRFKTGSRPYRLMIPPRGGALFVSTWGDGSIHRHDLKTGADVGRTFVGPHPTDMVWLDKPPAAGDDDHKSDFGARLFVAAANTNTVYSFGVTDQLDLRKLEAINVLLTPLNPLGMTPSALALDKDGHRLYVVCSDANAVVVADVSGTASTIAGFIPTGWYPTAVRILDDYQVVILNGKGLGAGRIRMARFQRSNRNECTEVSAVNGRATYLICKSERWHFCLRHRRSR